MTRKLLSRMGKATVALRKLEKRAWGTDKLRIKTKILIY